MKLLKKFTYSNLYLATRKNYIPYLYQNVKYLKFSAEVKANQRTEQQIALEKVRQLQLNGK